MDDWEEEKKFIEEKQLNYIYKFLVNGVIQTKNNNDFVLAYQSIYY